MPPLRTGAKDLSCWNPVTMGVRFSHFGITCNLATATFTITANLSSGGTAPFLLCTHARGVA